MSYKIAIASGKGGTGKTSISVNLFHNLNQMEATTIVDCDVEEPNDLIFFPSSKKITTKNINLKVAQIDNEKCTFCRKCVNWCEFNAITVIPPVSYTKIDPQLCHACGACLYACEDEAIVEIDHQIGEVHQYQLSENGFLEEGNLKIGSPMQTSLIKALKTNLISEAKYILFDAPPGTSCPVVETISDSDYIILVTEPTPFGLHDLKLMIELLKQIHIPFGVVINKSGMAFQDTYHYLKENQIEILAEIPFSKEYAALYSTGDILKNQPMEIKEIYKQLTDKLILKLQEYEGTHHS